MQLQAPNFFFLGEDKLRKEVDSAWKGVSGGEIENN